MQYSPDKWLIIDISNEYGEHVFKLFASWYGGYMGSDQWRLNSGITDIKKEGDFYLIYGHSSSVYKVYKGSYGTTSYGAEILDTFPNIRVLGDKYNWLEMGRLLTKG